MSNITKISSMFGNSPKFNGKIGNWNTSSVTNMSWMFSEASSFNQPLYEWNTSSVSNMSFMFYGATSFNQEIRTWDVLNVLTNGSNDGMFRNATAFEVYTSIENPQLDFWRLFSTYTVKAEDLSWSDVDITYYKNPVYDE